MYDEENTCGEGLGRYFLIFDCLVLTFNIKSDPIETSFNPKMKMNLKYKLLIIAWISTLQLLNAQYVSVTVITEASQQMDGTSNADPSSLATYNGSIYWAYINPDRYFTVAKKTGDNIQRVEVFLLEANLTDLTHISPTLGIDKNGYIHISGDMHNSNFKYFRSNNPEDITSWTKRFIPVYGVTHTSMFYDNNKDLYITFRHRQDLSAGGNHRAGVIKYNADNDTFAMLGGTSYNEKDGLQSTTKTLIWSNGFGGNDCWYIKPGHKIHFDGNNRMHVMAMLIDQCIAAPLGYESNTTIIYAYSDDFGLTWHKAGGELINELPLSYTNASVVLSRSVEHDIFGNLGEIGAFSSDRPVISYRLSSDKTNHTVMWNGSSWIEIFPPNHTEIFMSMNNGFSAWSNGNSIYYTSDGENWTQGISDDLKGGNYGSLDREYFKQTGNFRYFGKFNSFTNGSIFTIVKGDPTEVSGNNVALNKPVRVSSTYNDTYTGKKAVDGDIESNESRWVSARNVNNNVSESLPEWIEVDLQGKYKIDSLSFWTGSQGNYLETNVDFRFQYWNGTNWIDIFSETGNTNSKYKKSFTPISVEKVRLYITKVENAIVRLYELMIFEEQDIPSGTNSFELNNSFSLYPNPTSGNVTIHFNNRSSLPNEIILCNSSGQRVWYKKTNENTIKLNVGHFPKGLYLVQVKSKTGTMFGKLIVN